jgi:hypothetical protein
VHDLSPAEAWHAGRDRTWPKWSSICLLHSLGLPVIDACCVPPRGAARLEQAVDMMAKRTGSGRLMLRSDGGVETRDYYRGGVLLEGQGLLDEATRLLRDRRAILLLKATNRLTNKLTAVFRLDRPHPRQPGELSIEVLGPGYDVADIARGVVPPEVRVFIRDLDWNTYREPWWSDIKIEENDFPADERRRRRLAFVGSKILQPSGLLPPSASEDEVARWLRAQGHHQLWRPLDRRRVAGRVKSWFDELWLIAKAYPNRDWRCLATGWCVMEDGRPVYWDIVDAHRKYGLPAD